MTINVSLTHAQRMRVNVLCLRLGLKFNAFTRTTIDKIVNDEVKLGELRRRIVIERDMPMGKRSGPLNAQATCNLSTRTMMVVEKLAEDYRTRVGLVCRAAILMRLDKATPEVEVSADTVARKAAELVEVVEKMPHVADDFAGQFNAWFAGPDPVARGWVSDVGRLATAMGCDPWKVLVWLHGVAIDVRTSQAMQEVIRVSDLAQR